MAVSEEPILSQWRAIVICLIAALGAFQFGYDSSYFSGSHCHKYFSRVSLTRKFLTLLVSCQVYL